LNPFLRYGFLLMLLCLMLVLLAPVLQAQNGSTAVPAIACSPSPCKLPNTHLSRGSGTLSTAVNIASSPNNAQHMVVGVTDSNCGPNYGAVYSTTDGGATWARNCLPRVDPIYEEAPPALVYGSDNVVHAITTLINLDDGEDPTVETRSRNNGVSWSPLTAAGPNPTYSFTSRNDAVLDNDPGSPFAGRIYNSVTQDLSDLEVKIFVSRSNDGGHSWKSAVGLNLDRSRGVLTQGFSHMAIGKGGTLYLTAMATGDHQNPQKILFAKSSDGGVTWSAPVRVYDATGVTKIPNTSVYASDSPVIAVDNSDGPFAGRLYVTFYNFNGTFMQVVASTSSDDGATWSTPVAVAPPTATHDQFQPFVSVSSTGIPAIAWLDRRIDPDNVQYVPLLAFSRDGGATWGQNIALTTTLSQVSYGSNGPVSAWSGSTLYVVWPFMKDSGPLQEILGGFVP